MDYAALLLLGLCIYTTQAISYDGTAASWTSYEKLNLCPNADASLYLTFKTEERDGLIAYMDDGGQSDYLMVLLKNGRVTLKYKFGEGADETVFERSDYDVTLNSETSIAITRQRMTMKLEIEGDQGTLHQIANFGSDLCFGDCLDGYAMSPKISQLYVGGVPAAMKSQRLTGVPSFTGEIYNLEYKNCDCRPSNPLVVSVGEALTESAPQDPCFNKTTAEPGSGCVCRGDRQSNTCSCGYECISTCTRKL